MSDITGEEFGERAKSRLKIFVEGELTPTYWIKDDVRDALIYIGELEEAVAAAQARIADLEANEAENDAIFADKDAEIERLTNLALSVREERESLKAEVANLKDRLFEMQNAAIELAKKLKCHHPNIVEIDDGMRQCVDCGAKWHVERDRL